MQEAMRRAHLGSALSGPPTGEHPGEGAGQGRAGLRRGRGSPRRARCPLVHRTNERFSKRLRSLVLLVWEITASLLFTWGLEKQLDNLSVPLCGND